MSDGAEAPTATAAATAADEREFVARAERHRRELHVHCYRMLASFEEAEDAVQETLLRAWRRRETFDDGGQLRAWLYRIATNVCLDALRRRSRRGTSATTYAELPWLTPYPDRLLDEIAGDDEPDAVVVGRETIELAFLAAMQALPPRQRAALIVRDVLGWSANETASLLETSVAAANSALQRARTTMADRLPQHRAEWTAGTLSAEERDLLERFIEASERNDAVLAVAISSEHLRITMPPHPFFFEGLEAITPLMANAMGPDRMGDWRLVPTMANRMPTAASYLRRTGDTIYRAFKFEMLRVEGDRIAEITTFGPELFSQFGLADTLQET